MALQARVREVIVETDKDACSAGEAVVVKVYVRPDVYCFCLEHEWVATIAKIESGEVVQEWRWTAKSGELGYRERALEWIPSEGGSYRIVATLSTHGSAASKTVIVRES